jgi:hypothetical protein
MNEAPAPPPPRTDPLAAALAFAVREAVRLEAERLEAEREALNCAPVRANVVLVNTKREADAA